MQNIRQLSRHENLPGLSGPRSGLYPPLPSTPLLLTLSGRWVRAHLPDQRLVIECPYIIQYKTIILSQSCLCKRCYTVIRAIAFSLWAEVSFRHSVKHLQSRSRRFSQCTLTLRLNSKPPALTNFEPFQGRKKSFLIPCSRYVHFFRLTIIWTCM